MFLKKIVGLNYKHKKALFYIFSISIGILSGVSNIPILNELAEFIANAFVRIFAFISLPLVSLSLIVSLSRYSPEQGMGNIWLKTVFYAMLTTVIAASVALILYNIISPANMTIKVDNNLIISKSSYFSYISTLIPNNFIYPFLHGQVITILAICLSIAIAINFIENEQVKGTLISFFRGMHSVFLTITGWIMSVIPIAVGAFIASTILRIKSGSDVSGLGEYFYVIILSNLVQGMIVLPIFLSLYGLNPLKIAKGMMPAILVAFFSKSSTGTLPVTMQSIEKNLGVSPQISRAILPFCTSINMNGCAAFIFTTIVYVMQNNGIEMSLSQMFLWVIIASVAAAGNAGVPMGCFFLGGSLLDSMGVPTNIMGMILPFYAVVDMLETALNVWSDACVTIVVDKKFSHNKQKLENE
ncbi:dicarboxylate/amino acid:cation symporter [Candidatus Liberibacter americanus]|uniref:Na+/H+-dicarboxylate symporter n=1 Tax=Candidatus Liberibacter americanus str. Sao Paulo TaxID=1261131 RepID=U6B8Q6_9HYPH|nr:dicarboxylate/amino acid:cation symporter [Candidatus Liberibacter americanus]AHA28132.1 Na+/H+-dicarboxylate symporter [Candidatus Liberibacter americanus str. Sao Paulo]EMS36021.1 hypothetical protein G653_03471 [Candidatus Liberibacter americanus PW_SP]